MGNTVSYREVLAESDSEATLDLLHQQMYPQLTRDQFLLFIRSCRERHLSPWLRHLWPDFAVEPTSGRCSMTLVTTIEAIRLIADRSGEWLGTKGPLFCGVDGAWRDVWLCDDPPAGAMVHVLRRGFDPTSEVATWREYAQFVPAGGNKAGFVLSDMWRKMPTTMLAKCAEAKAFRKAFPERLSGLYSREEMMQAKNPATAQAAPSQIIGEFPPTIFQLNLKLLDWGFKTPSQREAVIEAFRRRDPALYATSEEEFCARVYQDILREPLRYGAKIELDQS